MGDHTPFRRLFSSFNNVLQVTSCFSAANLAESIPCQVLIWVTWRPLDLNFWWVITESEVSNFLISSGSQKGRYFTNHSLEILQSWNVLNSAVCRQKKNLTAQTKRNFLLILAVLIGLCWSFYYEPIPEFHCTSNINFVLIQTSCNQRISSLSLSLFFSFKVSKSLHLI